MQSGTGLEQMRTDWEAHYLDGQTPTRHRVTVRLTEGGLQIRFPRGPTRWWPYDEVRLASSFHADDPARLEHGGEFPEILQVSDPAFISTLRNFAPALHSPVRHTSLRLHWRSMALLALAGIVSSALALYLWFIPAMASLIAPYVPVSWEKELGRPVLEALAPEGNRCTDEARMAPVTGIVRRLEQTIPDRRHDFRVMVVNKSTMNAVAVPGGTIVIFQGLLDRTRRPEELAGVLAHEMQHVAQRHIMKLFLEHASSSVIISAVTGEGGDALAFGLESAKTLGLLRYSREHEAEADASGLRMMEKAGIDPRGMIAFFKTMSEEGSSEIPAALNYLSTHPDTRRRIDHLRKQLPAQGKIFAPLLPEIDWESARKVCGEAPVAEEAGADYADEEK